jgi:hypothetical protein
MLIARSFSLVLSQSVVGSPFHRRHHSLYILIAIKAKTLHSPNPLRLAGTALIRPNSGVCPRGVRLEIVTFALVKSAGTERPDRQDRRPVAKKGALCHLSGGPPCHDDAKRRVPVLQIGPAHLFQYPADALLEALAGNGYLIPGTQDLLWVPAPVA